MVDPFQAQVKAAVEETVAWGKRMEGAIQPVTVEVLPRVQGTGAAGGTTDTWPSVVLTFPGRINSISRPEGVNVGGGRVVYQLWEIVGPTGINVTRTARLRVNGKMYAIVDDDEPRSYSTAAHISCYEV